MRWENERGAFAVKGAALFLVFLLLSVALTWPFVLNLNTAVENDGDLPTGIWGVTWIARKAFTEPSTLLDAPFYHPHRRTLLFGLHNYMLGMIYAPFYYATGKPVAAWNLLYLTTLALNGFAMFLFVRYLTGRRLPGVISGLVFAFCPLRFGLYGFTAFQSTYWMPISLLFMGLYFDEESRGRRKLRFLLLGFLFYLFQFLTDLVLGIYFAFVFFPYVAFLLFRSRRGLRGAGYFKLGVTALIFVVLIALINSPYLLRGGGERENIVRSLDEIQELSADVSSYLAAPPSNLLYGRLTRNFWIHGMDFNLIGITAYALAVCGLFRLRPAKKRLCLRWRGGKRPLCSLRPGVRREPIAWFFFLIFLLVVLLSLGPEMHFFRRPVCVGPYMALYSLLPFIRVLRTLGWMAVAALFCLSVISGYGADAVLGWASRRHKDHRHLASSLIVILLLAESVHYPPTTFGQPLARIPGEVPAVYRWLIEEGAQGPIIELPMPWEPEEVAGGSHGLDSMYVYWSLFHGRRLVNGYSSFYPPEYQTVVNQMKLFPSRETIEILRLLGVRYVLVHTDKVPRFEWQRELVRRYPEVRHSWREAIGRTGEFDEELILKAHFGPDYVYEVSAGPSPPRLNPESFREAIPRSSWRVTATSKDGHAGRAIDGEEPTAWVSSGSQRAGIAYEVDLGAVHSLSGMELEPRNVNEYSKNPRIEVSEEGRTWREVGCGEPYLDLIARLLEDPADTALRVELPAVKARYVRITLTRFDNLFPWSVAELNIYGH